MAYMLHFDRKIIILTGLKFPAQEVPEVQKPKEDKAREEYERVVQPAVDRPVFLFPGKESEDENSDPEDCANDGEHKYDL